jgi:hypothetical protein
LAVLPAQLADCWVMSDPFNTGTQRYSLAIESKHPVMPVGRLTTQPSYAPMFTLERAPSL